MISVLVANVYKEWLPVEFMLQNMAAQTCRDFEIVLVDAMFDRNAYDVERLAQALGLEVVHTPACEAKHCGRILHWELFNNALLFSNRPWVLNHGVYRYMHKLAMQTASDKARAGICTVFHQRRINNTIETVAGFDIDTMYGLHTNTQRMDYLSNTGFFTIPRDVLIRQLNGHNEAVVNDHWVDCDLSERARKVGLGVEMFVDAYLRFERTEPHYGIVDNGKQVLSTTGIGTPTCDIDVNPDCPRYQINLFKDYRRCNGNVDRVVYDGFEWVQCPKCKTLCVENAQAYVDQIASRPDTRAPINVNGIGRNLALVDADLRGVTLPERIAIVTTSHDNPKYLQP